MKNRALFVLISGLLMLASYGLAQQFDFASIDVQCPAAATRCPAGIAPGEMAMATWASGIGPAGEIVGGYMTAGGIEHGYLYQDGVFTSIDVPGDVVGLDPDVLLQGEVGGINPRGDMVGDYFVPQNAPDAPSACVSARLPNGKPNPFAPACHRGFLYSRGQFSTILVTDPHGVTHLGSIPSAISPDGTIYGCLHDTTLGAQMIGFVRIQHGKSTDFETLQAGAGEVTDPSQSSQSIVNSMNNAATPDGSFIVGLYVPPGAARAHGYTVQNGHFTDYMFPGSVATQIWGINPDGDFVGLYRDSALVVHGFLQPGDGSAPFLINYVDPDTHVQAPLTEAFSINPAGAIVGTYLDSGGQHGFLAIPAASN
jgi:hypothetical protein